MELATRNIEEMKMLLRQEGSTEAHILRTDGEDFHFWRNFAESLLQDTTRLQTIHELLTKKLTEDTEE